MPKPMPARSVEETAAYWRERDRRSGGERHISLERVLDIVSVYYKLADVHQLFRKELGVGSALPRQLAFLSAVDLCHPPVTASHISRIINIPTATIVYQLHLARVGCANHAWLADQAARLRALIIAPGEVDHAAQPEKAANVARRPGKRLPRAGPAWSG